MTKAEVVQAVAQEAGLTLKDAGAAVDAVFETIKKALKKGDEVRFTGFGTFKTSKRAARQGINPKTGVKIKIKARTVPKFSAGKELKEIVA